MELVSLEIAAAPEAWRDLGFAVSGDGEMALGGVAVTLVGAGRGRGIVSAGLGGAPGGSVDGLPFVGAVAPVAREPVAHPIGATRIDHIVALTPHPQQTFAALESAGAELRRVREATGPDGAAIQQGFFWIGDVILEVGGPAEADSAGARTVPGTFCAGARFWGLTVVVEDLDAAATRLGDRLGRVKDAVQPGRRIATVRKEAGAGLPLALITPHAGDGS
jgi:hypothetical protein